MPLPALLQDEVTRSTRSLNNIQKVVVLSRPHFSACPWLPCYLQMQATTLTTTAEQEVFKFGSRQRKNSQLQQRVIRTWQRKAGITAYLYGMSSMCWMGPLRQKKKRVVVCFDPLSFFLVSLRATSAVSGTRRCLFQWHSRWPRSWGFDPGDSQKRSLFSECQMILPFYAGRLALLPQLVVLSSACSRL
jgi:hypothetical protein